MTPTTAAEDSEDMHALQRGEDRALDRLMTRWQAPLRAFLYRQLLNEQDAFDLAQETFVRVYRKRAQFRPEAMFSTWLFAIACNLARDSARARRRHPTEPLDDLQLATDNQGPSANVEEKERAAAVRAAIGALPNELRTTVVLFEYEDMSHAEIAEIVGATSKAVETRLHRARQLLKKALSRYLNK